MSVTRRKYTRDFKLQVVSEIEQGMKTRAQVTREYELSEGLVVKWVNTYKREGQNAFTGSGNSLGNTSEVDKLKAKVNQLEWVLGRKTLEVELLRETVEKLKTNGSLKKG